MSECVTWWSSSAPRSSSNRCAARRSRTTRRRRACTWRRSTTGGSECTAATRGATPACHTWHLHVTLDTCMSHLFCHTWANTCTYIRCSLQQIVLYMYHSTIIRLKWTIVMMLLSVWIDDVTYVPSMMRCPTGKGTAPGATLKTKVHCQNVMTFWVI